MQFKRYLAAVLCAALLIGALAGCSSTSGTDETGTETSTEVKKDFVDKVFTLNCSLSGSFNPMSATDANNIVVTELMYDMLVDVDTSYVPQANIVSAWASEDAVNWTFNVDTTAKFSDGSAVTANDAVYSIQCAMNSDRFSQKLKCIKSVSVSGDDSFAVELSYADSRLPALLCIPLIKNGSIYSAPPLGTGPYVLDTASSCLTKNAYYHKGTDSLPLDKIYLAEVSDTEQKIDSFENGKLDLVINDPLALTNVGYGSANEQRTYPTTNMHYIAFRMGSTYFSNQLFRKAMTYLIDREEIVTNVMNGMATAATLPMNPAADSFNEIYAESLACSKTKAEEALDAAGVKDNDGDGYREISITGVDVDININFLVCSESTYKVQAANAIADELGKYGIRVTVNAKSWDDYNTALQKGNFDMYYAETKLTEDFSLRNLLCTGGSLNYGGVMDSQTEGYIAAFLSASDDDRQKAADDMFTYLADYAPIVPICFEKLQVVTHQGVVTGLRPTQDNIFYGLDQWTVSMD